VFSFKKQHFALSQLIKNTFNNLKFNLFIFIIILFLQCSIEDKFRVEIPQSYIYSEIPSIDYREYNKKFTHQYKVLDVIVDTELEKLNQVRIEEKNVSLDELKDITLFEGRNTKIKNIIFYVDKAVSTNYITKIEKLSKHLYIGTYYAYNASKPFEKNRKLNYLGLPIKRSLKFKLLKDVIEIQLSILNENQIQINGQIFLIEELGTELSEKLLENCGYDIKLDWNENIKFDEYFRTIEQVNEVLSFVNTCITACRFPFFSDNSIVLDWNKNMPSQNVIIETTGNR